MKISTIIRFFIVASLFLLVQPSPVLSASFTKGDLVVSRTATNTAAGVSVFLDEYSPTGTLVQTVALPTTASGSNRPFVISGQQNFEGTLNLSTDKRYLVMGGYKTGAGNASTASGNTRIVATVDNNALVNTSTELTDFDFYFKSVASPNGTDLWIDGNVGIHYTTLGATTSTRVSIGNDNIYNTGIYDNKLYFCTEVAGYRFGYLSNGLPTTANQPFTVLGSAFAPTAIASLQAPYGFVMFDMDASIPGVDVVYMAEGSNMAGGSGGNNASRGLVKYSLNSSGAWVKAGAIIPAPVATDGLKQLTGSYDAATGVVTLYAVTQAAVAANATSSIVKITDATGYNGSLSGSFTTVVTSGANTAFKGIAFAPQAGSMATVPDAPASVAATPGNTQASVAFSTPNNNGGSTITSYTVTPYIAGVAQTPVTGTGSPILVSGLTNGTAYTFTVTATNSIGAAAVSAPSAAVTPLLVPDAPIIGTATVSGATVTVPFTAPVSNGGSTITSYTVTSNPRGGVGTLTQAGSGTITVTGLISGNAYTFTVKATNATGTSIASGVSNSVTPYTVPGQPGTPTATAGVGQASVKFFKANLGNDQAITSYTVIPYIDAIPQTTVSGTSSPIVVTGLTGGTAYTFKVYATNLTGNSPISVASTAVTPTSAVPGSPTSIVASPGNAQVSVAFGTPAANGAAITGYTVTTYIGGVAQAALTTGTASPIQVTGLTNGTAYTFTVYATNSLGNGAVSTASAQVTPNTNPVPYAPTNVTAAFSDVNGFVTVTFTAPPSNGGSAITGYTVTPYIAGVAQTAVTGTGSPIVVTGLTNGTTYTFAVIATNAAGNSAACTYTLERPKAIHYKIFVLSGQSNAVGVAANTDFPMEYQTEQTNVQIWAGMQVDISLTNRWINVKPGFGNNLANSGCELSFAREISKRFPNEHFRIIKGAWSATSMVDYWLSPSAGTPAKADFYHSLINSTIQPALNSITANGDSYELAGFLWMQGESDAIVETSANAYESNLSNFITDIRKDLNVEKLPFIIAKIDATPSWPFNAIVRQAQDNVASKLKNVGIFDTHGFETDGIHYLSAGYVKMGIQFSNQYINVFPKVYVSQIWDDAILNDLRLMGIFKKYNAKATFAIDAGNLTESEQPLAWVVQGVAYGKVSISDVKNYYADFEVANHGLTHILLTTATDAERTRQIVESKKLLESWLNRPINGFVYPGCPYDVPSEIAVKNAGHTWARTCENTPDFCSNTNFFEFRTTVGVNAANFWTEFNRIKATGGVFTFWGHAFFTTEAQWTDIESKIAQLSQDPAVVWTNTSDLFNQFNTLCSSTTNVVVPKETITSKINVYQSGSNIVVDLKDLTGSQKILIYDMNGKNLVSRKANGGEKILITKALNSGVYVVKVQGVEKTINTKLIII